MLYWYCLVVITADPPPIAAVEEAAPAVNSNPDQSTLVIVLPDVEFKFAADIPPVAVAPDILTVLPTWNPWPGKKHCTVVVDPSVVNGSKSSDSLGVLALSKYMLAEPTVKLALCITNVKSLVWSAVQLLPFCDINNDPKVGC